MSSVRPAEDLVLVECARAHVRPITKRTDIVRIELINTHANRERRHAQRPGQDRCERGELAFVDVIHQDGIELGINDSKAEQISHTKQQENKMEGRGGGGEEER